MPKEKDIEYIALHTSDSKWGDVDVIRDWHKERGWSDIGYHYVILNGFEKGFKGKTRNKYTDGAIREGRPIHLDGAHVPELNDKSIGVCLIGKDGEYTDKQLASCRALVVYLMDKYLVPVDKVVGHYETKSGKRQGKTCPDLDMNSFRKSLNSSKFMLHSYLELVL